MAQSKHLHWFMQGEYKWRTLASTIAVFLMTFPCFYLFIALTTFQPSLHIHNIVEILDKFVSVKACFFSLLMSCTTAATVRIYYSQALVAVEMPTSRFSTLRSCIVSSHLFYTFVGVNIFTLQTIFTCRMLGSNYYFSEYCHDDESLEYKSCLNEIMFCLILYSCFLASSHSLSFFLQGKNEMFFLVAHQTKFRYLKNTAVCTLTKCASKSFNVAKYFLAVYYIIGHAVYAVICSMIRIKPSDDYILSIWSIWESLVTSFTICLVGTFILFLWETSWTLFNIYNTQNYHFMLDSIFPEDRGRTLYENLDDKNPPLAQFLAFQFLSAICQRSAFCRKHIFDLNQHTEGGRAVRWQRVSRACLKVITDFTTKLNQHHRAFAGSNKLFGSKLSHSFTSSTSSQKSSLSESVVHRRPTSTEATDTSAFLTNNSSVLAEASYLNNSMTSNHVPTPTLWTKQFVKASVSEVKNVTVGNTTAQTIPAVVKKTDGAFTKLLNRLKAMKIVSYFINPMPEYVLRNLYCGYHIQQWAVCSLSCLCAASVTEDEYGVVQQKLSEIISAFIELLQALEKNSKASLVVSGQSGTYTLLRSEVKCALYRLTDAFGKSLNSINLPPDHYRRIQAFAAYKE